MRKTALWLPLVVLALSGRGFNQTSKKPVLFVPLAQPELAVNLIKECPAADVTWLQDKADFVVSWELNEKENRNDWVVYTADGHVVGAGETIRVSAAARDICKAVTAK